MTCVTNYISKQPHTRPKALIPVDPPEYVIDFGVVDDRAYVIELNPFGRPNGCGTGTVLFDNKCVVWGRTHRVVIRWWWTWEKWLWLWWFRSVWW